MMHFNFVECGDATPLAPDPSSPPATRQPLPAVYSATLRQLTGATNSFSEELGHGDAAMDSGCGWVAVGRGEPDAEGWPAPAS